MIRLFSMLLAVCVCYALPACTQEADLAGKERALIILAPASMENLLTDIAADWASQGRPPPRFSFAATSDNARQLEQGAEADIFISADAEWMRYLHARNIVGALPPPIAKGRLALVSPSTARRSFTAWQVAQYIGPQGRLAIAEQGGVPLGRYARASLEALGEWPKLRDQLVEADNARAVLRLAERGEVTAAIVYESDAKLSHKVQLLGILPENSHPPVAYFAAMTLSSARKKEAQAFLTFVRSAQSAKRMAQYGFYTKDAR